MGKPSTTEQPAKTAPVKPVKPVTFLEKLRTGTADMNSPEAQYAFYRVIKHLNGATAFKNID